MNQKQSPLFRPQMITCFRSFPINYFQVNLCKVATAAYSYCCLSCALSCQCPSGKLSEGWVGSWQWVLSNQGCQVTGRGRHKPRPGGDTVLAAPNTFVIRAIDFSDTHNFMYSRPAGSAGGGSPLGIRSTPPKPCDRICFYLFLNRRYVSIQQSLFVSLAVGFFRCYVFFLPGAPQPSDFLLSRTVAMAHFIELTPTALFCIILFSIFILSPTISSSSFCTLFYVFSN